ncbi:JAGN1 [Branchiostoma lanceolatum]|uniref:Protein jagunal homolog 1 n=1 Tax=Branchiostoma lanceolatum TaxID=7740 RepID=A0A8J9YIP7_BRALA|nr:JAGN1 [Branchiostoma lanceolatum]
MASRGGKHVIGSDGSDFLHRERVADHYLASAKMKTTAKQCMVGHLVLVALVLSHALLGQLGFLEPPAKIWEKIWILSAIPALFGIQSLPRNKVNHMNGFFYGVIVLGLLPLCWGVVDLVAELRTATLFMFGYPAVYIYYTGIAVGAVLHVLGLYYSRKLVEAWTAKGQKRQ